MSGKNRKPVTKQEVIIEFWEQMGKPSAGALELEKIHQTLLERFDAAESPAAIARVLADHGARLSHPQILEADVRWRELQQLFTPDELNFGTLAGSIALIEKIERLHQEFHGKHSLLDHLRQSVRQLKSELQVSAANEEAEKKRQLAQEVAEWLTIWLQNPQIFSEWLILRRNTVEFSERFES